MLGDIVPNNGGTANADGGAAKPGGYGAASFGDARPAPSLSVPAAPLTDATLAEIASVDPLSRQSGSKLPLVLTVVGVLVFITGVSGLFMYALSGS